MIIIRKLLTFYKPKYTDMYCLMALGSTMGDWSLPRRHIDSNFRTQLFDFTLFFLKKKQLCGWDIFVRFQNLSLSFSSNFISIGHFYFYFNSHINLGQEKHLCRFVNTIYNLKNISKRFVNKMQITPLNYHYILHRLYVLNFIKIKQLQVYNYSIRLDNENNYQYCFSWTLLL